MLKLEGKKVIGTRKVGVQSVFEYKVYSDGTSSPPICVSTFSFKPEDRKTKFKKTKKKKVSLEIGEAEEL
ncbi:hypothetical protein [uncultured Arcobacter sp.]|uniref:hypothetical protein n=1 Tax=uncultured Arcobacter sp. TaxID=165434 RepID=UPI002633E2C8|nr:hypothetical protein [uncultured Arcobacter sp.]